MSVPISVRRWLLAYALLAGLFSTPVHAQAPAAVLASSPPAGVPFAARAA